MRADSAGLTPAQREYLHAVRPYDTAVAARLDTKGSASLAELVDWAEDMKTAEHRVVDTSPGLTVPAEAQHALDTLLEEHRKALAAWQAATAATSRDQAAQQIDAACLADKESRQAAQDVRRALGLSTSMRTTGRAI